MDFDDSDVSITAWELLCVEVVDFVCKRAYMKFDFICVHFSHMTDFKWIFSDVKINSESNGGVVFSLILAIPVLIEWYVTSTKNYNLYSLIYIFES